MQKTLQRITPFLWFDHQAEEAANFYVSIFKSSRIASVARYDAAAAQAAGRPEGSVMTVTFELDGQAFTALNGGPLFKFTEAISFVVNCQTQAEVDHFWEKLSAGGQEVQCGWLKDRFGVSWQVVPTVLAEVLQDTDREKSKRVMAALLQMKRIDTEALKNAYEGARVAAATLSPRSADTMADTPSRKIFDIAAGGTHAMEPQDHGFMYGWSFYDPDGHHWEVFWMDPKAAVGGDVARRGDRG